MEKTAMKIRREHIRMRADCLQCCKTGGLRIPVGRKRHEPGKRSHAGRYVSVRCPELLQNASRKIPQLCCTANEMVRSVLRVFLLWKKKIK